MNDLKIQEDLLEQIAEGSLVPEGTVTVEIRDERGKVRDREVKPNFISKAWKLHARALLRTRWMKFGYNNLFSAVHNPTTLGPLWNGGRHGLPRLPNDHIACWNQTTAEDSVNEESPVIPGTGLVAWATRHPFGSASGARGNVNITESDLTDFRSRFVFDWNTAQGNGTFQSVGWLTMSYPGLPHMHLGKGFRRRFQTAAVPSVTSYIAGTTNGYYPGGGWIDPSNGKLYFIVVRYNQSPRGQMRVLSVDMSGLNNSNDNGLGTAADVTGMAITTESDEFSPTSGITTNTTPTGLTVIGRDGTNTIFVYETSIANESQPNNWRWGKVGAAGASTTYASSGNKTGYACGAVLGGFAYIGNSYDTFNIQKYNISTGALDSTITIDAQVTTLCTLFGITTPKLYDIVTDGTDLILFIEQQLSSTTRHLCVRVSITGTLIEVLGDPGGYQSSSNPTEISAAPYNAGTGIYQWPANQLWEPSQELFLGNAQANIVQDTAFVQYTATYDSYIWPATRGVASYILKWVYYDGALHLLTNPGGFQASRDGTVAMMFMWYAYRRGMDLGSRVLLGTSKTKLNTETMKITYDVTLPGWSS